jgi:dihydrofolate synthase/folylpolyglutamate synthase
VEVAGRCQVLPGRPQIVLDVAHNPQAAAELARSLGGMGYARTTWAVFGMMADKDIAGVVAAMQDHVDRWLSCDLPGPRAASAAQLAEIIAKVGTGETAGCFDSPAAAMLHAQENAGGDDRILVFGSFLTVAGVMRFLNRGKE